MMMWMPDFAYLT